MRASENAPSPTPAPLTDDEKRHNFALALNLKRRHVTREQFRELIAAECERTPDASDREIGRRLGCSHHTVATVRRPVSKDTPEGGKLPTPRVTREEAEALTEEIRAGLASWDRSMRGLLRHCFSGTVSPADLAESLQSQQFTNTQTETSLGDHHSSATLRCRVGQG